MIHEIIVGSKKENKCGTFEHQEVEGLATLENVETIVDDEHVVDESSIALESHDNTS